MLAEGGDEAVALQAPLGLQPRGQRQPGHHVPHQLLQVALALLGDGGQGTGSQVRGT